MKSVNTSLKLTLLLAVSLEKHIKLVIVWTVMTNVSCTSLLVTSVKNNTLVKQLTTSVADGIIAILKAKVLKEEKSAYKNIYINILKVKGILSF